jgi:hypothetical protein
MGMKAWSHMQIEQGWKEAKVSQGGGIGLASGWLRQEYLKFQASVSYTVRPCLKNSKDWSYSSVVKCLPSIHKVLGSISANCLQQAGNSKSDSRVEGARWGME